MKKYVSLYFLLGFLLIMGAFASMAQNSYGMSLLGIVALLFSALFLAQWLARTRKKGFNADSVTLESLTLSAIALLTGLGIFQVEPPFAPQLIALSGLVLCGVYSYRAWALFSQRGTAAMEWTLTRVIWYLALICFILSFCLAPYLFRSSSVFSTVGAVLAIGFLGMAFIGRNYLVEGTSQNAWSWILGLKDRSPLLIVLFLLMALHFSLMRAGILPKLYTDDYPQAFYDMERGPSGKDGKGSRDEHRPFKRAYDEFVKRNLK
jgi:hypothetical protein